MKFALIAKSRSDDEQLVVKYYEGEMPGHLQMKDDIRHWRDEQTISSDGPYDYYFTKSLGLFTEEDVFGEIKKRADLTYLLDRDAPNYNKDNTQEELKQLINSMSEENVALLRKRLFPNGDRK